MITLNHELEGNAERWERKLKVCLCPGELTLVL